MWRRKTSLHCFSFSACSALSVCLQWAKNQLIRSRFLPYISLFFSSTFAIEKSIFSQFVCCVDSLSSLFFPSIGKHCLSLVAYFHLIVFPLTDGAVQFNSSTLATTGHADRLLQWTHCCCFRTKIIRLVVACELIWLQLQQHFGVGQGTRWQEEAACIPLSEGNTSTATADTHFVSAVCFFGLLFSSSSSFASLSFSAWFAFLFFSPEHVRCDGCCLLLY